MKMWVHKSLMKEIPVVGQCIKCNEEPKRSSVTPSVLSGMKGREVCASFFPFAKGKHLFSFYLKENTFFLFALGTMSRTKSSVFLDIAFFV